MKSNKGKGLLGLLGLLVVLGIFGFFGYDTLQKSKLVTFLYQNLSCSEKFNLLNTTR